MAAAQHRFRRLYLEIINLEKNRKLWLLAELGDAGCDTVMNQDEPDFYLMQDLVQEGYIEEPAVAQFRITDAGRRHLSNQLEDD